MKKRIFALIGFTATVIFTPGFQCGDPYDNICDTYQTDTAINILGVTNFNLPVKVHDTLKILSIVNDTIHSLGGDVFIPAQSYGDKLFSFQAYKVVTGNGGPMLDYANIEFNPIVIEGSFPNYSNNGNILLYTRVAPYNRLQFGLITSQPGLYLITTQGQTNYGSYRNPAKPCTSYPEKYYFPETQQQKNYWDSLGVNALKLRGSNNYTIKTKQERDYIFLKVNP